MLDTSIQAIQCGFGSRLKGTCRELQLPIDGRVWCDVFGVSCVGCGEGCAQCLLRGTLVCCCSG